MPHQPTITNMTSASSFRAALLACLFSFARGLVLVMVMVLPMVMLKRLGLSNSWAAFNTALLLLPFVLRGVLRPVAEVLMCRWYSLAILQFLMVISVWGVAGSVSSNMGVGLWLWLAVFSLVGAVHDIMAADMTALWCNEWKHQRRVQLCFVFGVLAAVLGMGVTMILAGDMEVLSSPGSIPGLGRSPGEGNGSPLQYSCLGNPMDRGAWATVRGVRVRPD